MCLDRITKRSSDMPPSGQGSKRFFINEEGDLFGDLSYGPVRPRGVWLNAKDFHTHSWNGRERTLNDDEEYEAAWHIYKNPNRGNTKILWRDPVCQGQDDGKTVIVAREIFIPEEKEEENVPK